MEGQKAAPVTGFVVCATKAYWGLMTGWHRTAICRSWCCRPALLRLETAREFHLDAHTVLMAGHMSSHAALELFHSMPAWFSGVVFNWLSCALFLKLSKWHQNVPCVILSLLHALPFML